jgi:3-deoxy-D-manno-octulosonic-acid transferase
VHLYFLLIRIAALLGHQKARKLVAGQRETLERQSLPTDCIWIHAASVGEFEQARPLIERLRVTGYGLRVVVTFFSPSGYEARKNYDKADAVLYLPFATRSNAKRFLDALQPKMAIFVKYEFWPAYLEELHARNIPTYSISSIFRPEQLFFRWWGKRHLQALNCFTHIYVQDEASLQLLQTHGVMQASVAGDTRFDRVKQVMDEGLRVTGDRFAPIVEFVKSAERVLVAGSTWPEDEVLLTQYIEVTGDGLQVTGRTKLILVPHEIDEKHLHTIFDLFKGRFVRYSEVTGYGLRVTGESQRNILQRAQVLVIDTIGLLSSIYRFGQVAYIGGGFGVGIHNTIEAAVYGVPVLFGPNYEHFREAKGLIAAGAARSIKDYNELETALETAFAQHETIGAKAADYVQSELGATAKIYAELFGN